MTPPTIKSSDLPADIRQRFGLGVAKATRAGGKFGVAAAERRTYRGVLYASRAEMARAEELDLMLMAGELRGWTRQVPFYLAPPLRYVVDFLVFHRSGRAWAEDVKGVETPAFRANARLWREHGPCPLEIRKPGGHSRTIIPRSMEGK